MKQIRMRIAVLGLAAVCWGIMFPEYTFTADSYAVVGEEIREAGPQGSCRGAEQACARDGYAWAGTAGAYEGGKDSGRMPCQSAEPVSAQEVLEAAREGKVRYRSRLYEYIKKIF